MGLDKEDILKEFELPPRKALKLYGALATAREERARDRGKCAFPLVLILYCDTHFPLLITNFYFFLLSSFLRSIAAAAAAQEATAIRAAGNTLLFMNYKLRFSQLTLQFAFD